MTTKAEAMAEPGCLPSCQAGRHKYDAHHPFPHPAELHQAGKVFIADEPDPKTEDMPRTGMVPAVVAGWEALTDEFAAQVREDERMRVLARLHRQWGMQLDVAPRGLPAPVLGFEWATSMDLSLPGSTGIAHLIPQLRQPGPLRARCGCGATAWMTVGQWESKRHTPCPNCSGSRVRS